MADQPVNTPDRQEGGSSTDCISPTKFYEAAKEEAKVPFLFHKILEIDNDGLEYTIKDHDITVRFPFGAVPVGEKILIEIGVAMYGPFKFVDNVQPISPIVWLCLVNEHTKFIKPFQLVLPHFLLADKVQYHQVGFAKANHSNYEENRYTFYVCDTKPIFASSGGKSYGVLETNHCCFSCLEAENNITHQVARDAGYTLVRLESPARQEVHFCAIYSLNTCLESLKKQFSPEEGYHESRCCDFKFKDRGIDHNYIKVVPPVHDQCVIAANPVSGKIKESDIDFWTTSFESLLFKHKVKTYPPRVMMTVDAPDRMKLLFKFEGCSVDSQLDDMEILFPLRWTIVGERQGACQSNVTIVRSNTILTDQLSTGGPAAPPEAAIDCTPTLGKLSIMKTTEGKKIKIIETVASKWMKLGDLLEFDKCGSKLESIKTKNREDPEECCREMFRHWLEGNGVRPCSWRNLIELLDDCDFEVLAEQVQSVFST